MNTTVFDNLSAWRVERQTQLRRGLTLGLVSTMGALHDGHVSLIRRSRAENDRTLVSIFVNPTQFDDPSDLANYPRTVAEDLELLRGEGTDFVLMPKAAELYADGYRYRITETDVSTTLEGAHRPGHFEAVLTVVMKLLQIARAEKAYFGEKDWQQLNLVQGMADAFFLPTHIIACPTVREPDGLAISSRNRRLAPADRQKAPEFYRTLSTAAAADEAARELRTAGFAVDYVEDQGVRRLGAMRLGGIRLIDNVSLGETR